tara:strand:- start:924 stop:3113 length:2190 start_codon:yes stop_codon:yes gene_type:complete
MNTPGSDHQINRFVDANKQPTQADYNDPEVVFPSALELTKEEEDTLVNTALQRMAELEDELGLDDSIQLQNYGVTDSHEDVSGNMESWLGRRHLYEQVYRMEMDWRESIQGPDGSGTIFSEHNIHIPQVRRIVQQQISRAVNYFMATDPWFSLDPQGSQDNDGADKLDQYAKFKAKQANLKATLAKAIELAFIRGECVVKSGFRREVDYYETFANVAIDAETDEPLVAEDQDYIFEDDVWIGAIDEETGELLDNGAGEPIMVLKRDPTTTMPEGEMIFERRKVRRLVKQFTGAELESVYYTDILVPKSARDIQSADCVVHTFEVPAIELAQTYMKRGLNPEDHPKFIDLLGEITGDSAQLRTGKDSARAEEGDDTGGSLAISGEPSIRIGEFYMKIDVNGDGIQENIMLVLDLDNKKPIFFDYLSNITPDGKRPLHVVRVNPVDGRWHGTSQVKLFYDLQTFTDTLVARWDFSESQSGFIDIVNKSAVEEGADVQGTLEINGGETFTLKPNKTPDDFFKRIYLTNTKSDELRSQIEYIGQVMTTLSGVTNANDAAMSGLDTTQLATGVKNIEKSGQELFAPLLDHLDPGLADSVNGFLKQTVHNMDEAEAFEFFEGAVRHIDEIKPDDARDIDFMVSMELTRYKGEQELVQGMQSIELIERFYAILDPNVQAIAVPVFINIGKLYGMKDADKVFVAGAANPMAPGQPLDQNAAMPAIGDTQPAQSPNNL